MNSNTIGFDQTMPGDVQTILVNRYRIVRQLGQGGMGSVWLAWDTMLDDREVAIKMLPSVLLSNKRAYNQLKHEALVSLKLTHPNIATVRAFEENCGNPFLVVDFIDGQTLDDYLAEKGTLDEGETMRLLQPIATALDYAHCEGVMHRDVKPANVMIRKDGHPFILDFGISREIQETMTRVTGKLSSGTLMYMSPEQLKGAVPNPSQDVYSFAAMAYECLCGHPPFYRGQIEYQILNETPAPLTHDTHLAREIMRGLSKRPEGRPATCAEMLTSKQIIEECPQHIQPPGATMPPRTVKKNRTLPILVGIASAVLCIALFFYLYTFFERPPLVEQQPHSEGWAQMVSTRSTTIREPSRDECLAREKQDPDEEILISLNGKTLRRGTLDADVEKIAKAQGDKVPADQQEYMRQMVRNQLAQAFVIENALVAKAKAMGFEVTPEERKAHEEEFLKAAAGRPDAPKSLDEFAEKFPLGKDRALQEFENGIIIDKMIKQEAAKASKTDYAAEAKKIIDGIVSNNNAQASAETDALKKINALKAELASPAVTNVAVKFAELAKANSACPSSAKGGDLGEFTHGEMVKEFDEAAFTLPVGKVSEPIKTQFGYHLILVTKKFPAVEAKDDTPATPEKVQASHILIKAGDKRPVPNAEELVKHLKNRDERAMTQKIIVKTLRECKIQVVDEFKNLLPSEDDSK